MTPAPPRGVAAAPFWTSRLWRKLAWAMVALGAAGPVAFGLSEMNAAVRDAEQRVGQLQQAQARDVAYAIENSLGMIRRQVNSVAALPWTLADQFTPAVRRAEYGRLLRLLPVLESLSFVSAQNRLLISVSRRYSDYIDGQGPARELPSLGSGQVGYRDAYEPVLAHEISHDEPKVGGRTVALVNLRALATELQEPLRTGIGHAYVVDNEGRVVLHQDPALMMLRRSLPAAVQATTALATRAVGLSGQDVLQSAAPVAGSNWMVVVEQPRDVVMAPIFSTALRTALVTGAAVLAAALAAVLLAGRITRPVRSLHGAAQQLAAGNLDTRVKLDTKDEIEDLAHQFNRMAASLQASVTELEARVAERTLELTEANRHKDEFLAGMSHELRTPLNGVLGFADVLRDEMAGPLNDDQKDFVSEIHRAGKHLLALITDLLDRARLGTGKLLLEPAAFDIVETLDMAAALVRRDCEHKNLSLIFTMQPDMPAWYGDARRIKQVALNLLTNAVKFTPEGGRIELRAGTSDDGSTWLEVQDSGMGIAPQDHERIFEWGQQVQQRERGAAASQANTSGSTPAGGGGLGLGLALARGIVQAHGGTVSVSSSLGQGATFRVTLPGAPSPAHEATADETRTPPP